jgi:hypothetical protein
VADEAQETSRNLAGYSMKKNAVHEIMFNKDVPFHINSGCIKNLCNFLVKSSTSSLRAWRAKQLERIRTRNKKSLKFRRQTRIIIRETDVNVSNRKYKFFNPTFLNRISSWSDPSILEESYVIRCGWLN